MIRLIVYLIGAYGLLAGAFFYSYDLMMIESGSEHQSVTSVMIALYGAMVLFFTAVILSLVGTGSLEGGSPVELSLTDAFPATTAWLVVGFSAFNAPFHGGVLVPDPTPPGFASVLPTGTGSVLLQARWPAGVPSGFTLWFQYWIEDAAGPVGFSASNGLSATAP